MRGFGIFMRIYGPIRDFYVREYYIRVYFVRDFYVAPAVSVINIFMVVFLQIFVIS